jgi:hypothetical protein
MKSTNVSPKRRKADKPKEAPAPLASCALCGDTGQAEIFAAGTPIPREAERRVFWARAIPMTVELFVISRAMNWPGTLETVACPACVVRSENEVRRFEGHAVHVHGGSL